jgi:hypothetical protein
MERRVQEGVPMLVRKMQSALLGSRRAAASRAHNWLRKLPDLRRLAPRYEKLAARHLAFIPLGANVILLRQCVNKP